MGRERRNRWRAGVPDRTAIPPGSLLHTRALGHRATSLWAIWIKKASPPKMKPSGRTRNEGGVGATADTALKCWPGKASCLQLDADMPPGVTVTGVGAQPIGASELGATTHEAGQSSIKTCAVFSARKSSCSSSSMEARPTWARE
jgi:hypothetical protein